MLEVIASSLEDAVKIEYAGGDRIELIMGFLEDGLTPSLGLLKSVKKQVKIPVNVMVRPHAKSFVLTPEDLCVMKEDMKMFKGEGANGLVLGAITEEGEVDERNLEILLKERGDLDITFHACFNHLKDMEKSLDILDSFGITNVLTKGGTGHILENLDMLKRLVARKNKVKILIGGNVTSQNITDVKNATGGEDFHIGTAARENNSQILGVSSERLKKFIVKFKSL